MPIHLTPSQEINVIMTFFSSHLLFYHLGFHKNGFASNVCKFSQDGTFTYSFAISFYF